MGIHWKIVLANANEVAAETCGTYLRGLNLEPVVGGQRYVWRDEELHVEDFSADEPAALDLVAMPWNALVQWQSADSSLWLDLGFLEIESIRYGLLTVSDRRWKDLHDTLLKRGLVPLDFIAALFKSSGCTSIVASSEFSDADLNALHRCLTNGQRLTGLDNLCLVGGVGAVTHEADLSEIKLIDGVEIRSRWPFTNTGL